MEAYPRQPGSDLWTHAACRRSAWWCDLGSRL